MLSWACGKPFSNHNIGYASWKHDQVGWVWSSCLSVSLSVSYSSLSEYRLLLLFPGGLESKLQNVQLAVKNICKERKRQNVPPPPPLLLPILDGDDCRELRVDDIDVRTCQGCPLPRPSNWVQAPATHLVKLLERGPTKSMHKNANMEALNCTMYKRKSEGWKWGSNIFLLTLGLWTSVCPPEFCLW